MARATSLTRGFRAGVPTRSFQYQQINEGVAELDIRAVLLNLTSIRRVTVDQSYKAPPRSDQVEYKD